MVHLPLHETVYLRWGESPSAISSSLDSKCAYKAGDQRGCDDAQLIALQISERILLWQGNCVVVHGSTATVTAIGISIESREQKKGKTGKKAAEANTFAMALNSLAKPLEVI